MHLAGLGITLWIGDTSGIEALMTEQNCKA